MFGQTKGNINALFLRGYNNFQTGPRFKIELEFRNVDFFGERKTGGPGEKRREPTNNSTHMKYPSRGSNPQPIGMVSGLVQKAIWIQIHHFFLHIQDD
jgi:hypothetical protein